jgi:lipopolysaccharide export system protein LptA
VIDPEATFFLENGQILVARSDHGDFVTPAGQDQPEGGQFTDNGIVRLYEPKGGRVDLENDEPSMVGSFEHLEFDMRLGLISTGDTPITFNGPDIEVRGIGANAFLNQADRSLGSFDIARRPVVRFIPPAEEERQQSEPLKTPADSASKPGAAGSGTAGAEGRLSEPTSEPTPRGEGAVRHYKATFEDRVVLMQGTRRIEADELTIYFRLIDNRLPEDAIAPLQSTTGPVEIGLGPHRPDVLRLGVLATAGLASGSSHVIPAQAKPGTAGPRERAPIELHAEGPLRVNLLDEIPPQLDEGNHLFAEFIAQESGVVVIKDDELGAELRCVSLQYAATSQTLRIDGRGSQGVTGTLPGIENVAIGWLEADFKSGTSRIPGGGEAITEDGGVLTWIKHADVSFDIDEEGRIWPTGATLVGRPTVRDEEGLARGERMIARFERTKNGDVALASTRFIGDSITTTPDRYDSIRADETLITFAHTPDENGDLRPSPVSFKATGNVVAKQAGGTDLTCDSLDARLEEDERGQVVVTRAFINGSIQFSRIQPFEPRTVVTAESIDADPIAKTALLTGTDGEPADVEYGGTTITGDEIRLDEIARFVSVFGAGEMTHTEGTTANRDDPDLHVRWSKQMIFDDREGDIQVHGDVAARFNHNAFEHDDIEAYRLHIALAPEVEGGDAELSIANTRRQVLRVEAISESIEFEGGKPAIVRSRRYTVDDRGERTLARAMNLESPRIIGDHVKGTLDAPGPGRLLVLDHRDKDADAVDGAPGPGVEAASGPTLASDARGAALFDWTSGMSLERESGTMVMSGDVRVTHKRLDDGSILNLECHRLTAQVALDETAETGNQSSQRNIAGDLESVTATDAVYVRWQGRELIADRINYDAHLGVLTAKARDLTLFDSASATVTKGASLEWDLKTDRVTWSGATPITAPISSETRRRLSRDR